MNSSDQRLLRSGIIFTNKICARHLRLCDGSAYNGRTPRPPYRSPFMSRMLAAVALLFTTAAVVVSRADEPPTARPARKRQPVVLTEEALKIHHEALVVDGHNDLPWQYRRKADLSF